MISLPFGRLSRRGVLVLAGSATGIVLVGGGVAWAYWDTTASVPTYAFADSVGAGGAPTAAANNGSINLTWPAGSTVAGHAVGGYLVNRYAAGSGGTATPAAQGTCAAGPVSATTCTETNLPAGTWYYTVTPVLGAWHGAESPRSNGISTADTFALSLSAGVTAGTSSTLTITAKAGSQTDAGYTGARTLTFSGPGTAPDGTHTPTYPNSPVTFTNGVATVPITLYKAESTSLSVADGTVTGSTGVTVNAAAATQFAVSAPSSATAGNAQSVTVTAQDAYQNKATGYTGTKTLTWTGPGNAPDGTHTPTYPANPVTFISGTAAVAITLYRAETTSLTASDGMVSGTSASFTVAAAAATQFNVPTPAAQTAGTAFPLTLTAQDPYQNKATSYTGTKTLTWTGPGNAPDGTDTPSYSSVTFSAGTGTATVTLVKAESTTLKAGDGTISGTSGTFTVNAGRPARLAWTSASVSRGSISSPCFFSCTVTSLSNGQFTARISVTDADGNTVNNLGAGNTVTLTMPDGGTVSGTPVTIAASGPAVSGIFSFNPQNGWSTDHLNASLGSYAGATATLSK